MNPRSIVFCFLMLATLGCGKPPPEGDAQLRSELEATKAEVARLRAELADLKDAGLLTQTGPVEIRLGETEVRYARPYAREPELTFTKRHSVSYQVVKQSATGFVIKIESAFSPSGESAALEWRARGEVKRPGG